MAHGQLDLRSFGQSELKSICEGIKAIVGPPADILSRPSPHVIEELENFLCSRIPDVERQRSIRRKSEYMVDPDLPLQERAKQWCVIIKRQTEANMRVNMIKDAYSGQWR